MERVAGGSVSADYNNPSCQQRARGASPLSFHPTQERLRETAESGQGGVGWAGRAALQRSSLLAGWAILQGSLLSTPLPRIEIF